MRTITGPFAEQRTYLTYVLAILRPGSEVPVFEDPSQAARTVDRLDAESLRLLVEEGRRQLERQAAELGRNQTRAATLLTVTTAELVFLFTSRAAVLSHSWPVDLLWWASVSAGVLAIAGCISVLVTPAAYGDVSLTALADQDEPLAMAATAYVEAAGVGAVTNAARLTVLRDAAWLAMITGVLLIAVTPASTAPPRAQPCVTAPAPQP